MSNGFPHALLAEHMNRYGRNKGTGSAGRLLLFLNVNLSLDVCLVFCCCLGSISLLLQWTYRIVLQLWGMYLLIHILFYFVKNLIRFVLVKVYCFASGFIPGRWNI